MSARTQSARKGSAKPAGSRKGKATVVSQDNLPKQTAEVAPRSSIRNTIRTMIAGGSSTAEISAVLTEKFPSSMAAQKAGKHISFYRAQLKKEAKEAAAAS